MAESIGTPSFLVGFIAVVLLLLALDLGVFHRAAHTVTLREALTWTVVWVGLSVGFGVWILTRFGSEKGLAFFTGYLIEWALSVDNVFVFILIFSYFAVPPTLHHRVLFWGILGALIMRAFFIVVGSALIEHFHWILYIFGAFLVFTGTKVLRQGDTEIDPDRNPVVRWFRRFVPMVAGYDSDRFWVRKDNQLRATPLALVLLTVETTDLIFAVDSIPAIFANHVGSFYHLHLERLCHSGITGSILSSFCSVPAIFLLECRPWHRADFRGNQDDLRRHLSHSNRRVTHVRRDRPHGINLAISLEAIRQPKTHGEPKS